MCAVVVILKYRLSPSAVCKWLESATCTRPKGLGRDLQALPQALVHQNFDIHTSVKLAALSVLIAGEPMGSAIADRDKHASHWDVLDLMEIAGHSGGAFFAELLVRLFA